MSTTSPDPGVPASLRIEGELTIYRAAELKQLLLSQPQLTEIDLSAVTEIDTAGVQLLLAARKAAQAQQRELHLVQASPSVLELLGLLNLGPGLGLPVAEAAA